jgi:hypothetical protein
MEPTEEWKRMFISGVKRKYESIEIRIRKAEDLQMPMDAHCDWVPASERASKFLSMKVKEPRELVFFRNGLYQFTFNDKDNRFSHQE